NLPDELSQVDDPKLDSSEETSPELAVELLSNDEQTMNVDSSLENVQVLAPNYNLGFAVQKSEEAVVSESHLESEETVPMPIFSEPVQSTDSSGKITMDMIWEKTDLALNWLSTAFTLDESGIGVNSAV